MIRTGIKDARQHLTEYLAKVQEGEEIIISKREEPIAILKSIKTTLKRRLGSHKTLRDSIPAKGALLSEIVSESRKEERY